MLLSLNKLSLLFLKLAYSYGNYNLLVFESSYFFQKDTGKTSEKIVVNICVFLLNNLLLRHPTIF